MNPTTAQRRHGYIALACAVVLACAAMLALFVTLHPAPVAGAAPGQDGPTFAPPYDPLVIDGVTMPDSILVRCADPAQGEDEGTMVFTYNAFDHVPRWFVVRHATSTVAFQGLMEWGQTVTLPHEGGWFVDYYSGDVYTYAIVKGQCRTQDTTTSTTAPPGTSTTVPDSSTTSTSTTTTEPPTVTTVPDASTTTTEPPALTTVPVTPSSAVEPAAPAPSGGLTPQGDLGPPVTGPRPQAFALTGAGRVSIAAAIGAALLIAGAATLVVRRLRHA